MLLVVHQKDATVSFRDTQTGQVLALVGTEAGPHEIALSSDGKLAVVSNYGEAYAGNSLTLINVVHQEIIKTINLGKYKRPHGLVFMDENHILVTAEENHVLLKLKLPEGNIVKVYPINQQVSHMVALSPDHQFAYVTNVASNSMSILELSSFKVESIKVGTGPEGIDVASNGNIWLTNHLDNTLVVIEPETYKIIKKVKTAGFPIRVKIVDKKKLALVTNAKDDTLYIFGTENMELVKSIKFRLEVDKQINIFNSPLKFHNSTPVGIEISSDGNLAYVSHLNSNHISVINLNTFEIQGSWDAEDGPDGISYVVSPEMAE